MLLFGSFYPNIMNPQVACAAHGRKRHLSLIDIEKNLIFNTFAHEMVLNKPVLSFLNNESPSDYDVRILRYFFFQVVWKQFFLLLYLFLSQFSNPLPFFSVAIFCFLVLRIP